MARLSLDEYWTAMLPLVAARGTCPRRQVGAALVDAAGMLVATGYNGTAAGLAHCDSERPCPGNPALGGEREACEALHAEANAVMQARASRRTPATLYCSLTPCFPCAKLLLAAGVRDVVALSLYAHDDAGPRLLAKAGVAVWLWTDSGRVPWGV